ncbi:HNH endonuclease [Pectobacterium colocasium]|nr:HNH endonuclease [Pectobacterium sp. F1-1]
MKRAAGRQPHRPWKTEAEHLLNPSNGLCLPNQHDKAFDMGTHQLQ